MTENLEEQLQTGELEQKLNRAESHEKNVFAPEFIQFFPQIKKEFELTWLQTLIYGFIRWYLVNPRSSGKFYFTNEQLASIFDVSEVTISSNINKLADKKLIETEYELRGGGGKIRYVRLIRNFKSDLKSTLRLTQSRVCENNNKINKNKNNKEDDSLIREKYEEAIDYWNNLFGKNYTYDVDDREKKFKIRLKTYTLEDIKKAIKAASKDEFYSGKKTGFFADPDWIFRNDKNIEKLLNLETRSVRPKKILT